MNSEQELNLGETQEPQETGPRPQLLDSSLHIREAKVMNHRFEYAQAILDFDQKLYLNEALMCPFAELSCEDEYVAECSECDWDAVSVCCFLSLFFVLFCFVLFCFVLFCFVLFIFSF